MRVYTAGAMTGLSGDELVERSLHVGQVLSYNKIEMLDPVNCEGVKATPNPVQASFQDLTVFWQRDKQLIRRAHVVFDITPEKKSEGVSHEIGYARYFLYKPIVRVYMNGGMPTGASVAFFEDDVLAGSLEEACAVALELWGTPWKRLKWKLQQLNRCLLRSIKYKTGEWLNIFTPLPKPDKALDILANTMILQWVKLLQKRQEKR